MSVSVDRADISGSACRVRSNARRRFGLSSRTRSGPRPRILGVPETLSHYSVELIRR